MSKLRFVRMALALPLLYGVVPALLGFLIVFDWGAERKLLGASGAVLLLSGIVMLVSAGRLLVLAGRERLALLTGGAASLLSAGVFGAVTVSGLLPCTGSS
jgi:hypothetical protein